MNQRSGLSAYRKYLKTYLGFLIVLSALILFNYCFLRNSGEFYSLDKIVSTQQHAEEFYLYGTALHDDTDLYKLALHARTTPDIVALGSSRVFPFRRKYFSKPFLALNGLDHDINKSEHFVRGMLSRHIPDVALIGIDFWWFMDRSARPLTLDRQVQKIPTLLTPWKLLQPFIWLWEKKISWKDYFVLVFNLHAVESQQRIGVAAHIKNAGFGPDGSYYYGDDIANTTGTFKKHEIQKALNQIHQGKARYRYAQDIDERYFQRFVHALKTMQDKGVETLLFFPPLVSAVNEAINSKPEQYTYINKLKQRFADEKIHVFDFNLPQNLEVSDCEFFDGHHMGDITALKILKALNKEMPQVIQNYIHINKINQTLEQYNNLAFIPDNRITSFKETDFLDLGCKKAH